MLRNERTTTRRPGRCCATQTTMLLNAASGQGSTCRLLVVTLGLTPDDGHVDQRPAYDCSGHADRQTTPTCRSVAAATVDDAVADRHHRIGRAAELAVERARYEADRAERAFQAVEPENRLVARTLETRWEATLAALGEAEQALAAAREALPSLPDRAELERLAADLPALWQAPTTSSRDRKRLLRTLNRRHHPASGARPGQGADRDP